MQYSDSEVHGLALLGALLCIRFLRQLGEGGEECAFRVEALSSRGVCLRIWKLYLKAGCFGIGKNWNWMQS